MYDKTHYNKKIKKKRTAHFKLELIIRTHSYPLGMGYRVLTGGGVITYPGGISGLWGRTESDTTEVTYQQQQHHLSVLKQL